ncbi:MAG: vWA domain-containing protein [Hyphomicrobiaceae bacterium]
MIALGLSLGSKMRKWSVGVVAAALVTHAVAPTLALACRENAMIVFDASGSMALFRDGRPKIEIAREAARAVLPDITRYRPTGLVTYSGGRGPACSDVKLRVAPKLNSSNAILAALRTVDPNGATPLSDSVELAADSLRRLGSPGIIVLVTDGLENCGQNACLLGQRLKGWGDLIRVHVISFYLHGRAVETINCLSEATGGTYATTNSLDGLRDALHKVLSCNRISALDASLSRPALPHPGR